LLNPTQLRYFQVSPNLIRFARFIFLCVQYRQTASTLQLQVVSLRQQLVAAPSEPLGSLVNDTAERQSKQMSLLQQRRAEKEAERCREAVVVFSNLYCSFDHS
jgi:hypothetical protein